jgi:hypothetical protein
MDKITSKIQEHLIQVSQQWRNIIDNQTDSSLHHNNLEFAPNLLVDIETALKANTQEAYQDLLTTWNQNYPQWNDDATWAKKNFRILLKAYEKAGRKSDLKNHLKVQEQAIKIKELETKLAASERETQIYIEQLKDFKAEHEKQLTATETNLGAKFKELYQNHIDPENADEFMKLAETKFLMVVREKYEAKKETVLKLTKKLKSVEQKKDELEVAKMQAESEIKLHTDQLARTERLKVSFNSIYGDQNNENSQLRIENQSLKQELTIIKKSYQDLQVQLTHQGQKKEFLDSDLDSDIDLDLTDSNEDELESHQTKQNQSLLYRLVLNLKKQNLN